MLKYKQSSNYNNNFRIYYIIIFIYLQSSIYNNNFHIDKIRGQPQLKHLKLKLPPPPPPPPRPPRQPPLLPLQLPLKQTLAIS